LKAKIDSALRVASEKAPLGGHLESPTFAARVLIDAFSFAAGATMKGQQP